MSAAPSRRALLGALATVPMLVTLPALAIPIGATPFAVAYARYIAARDALNGSPDGLEETHPAAFNALEERYSDAVRTVDAASPTNWREFTQKLEMTIADGVTPGAELCNRLIAQAKRLVSNPYA